MEHLHRLVALFIFCCLAIDQSTARKKVTKPPTIVREPAKEIAYKKHERVELICAAQGDPRPTYRWERNGAELEIDGLNVKKQPGVGSIEIIQPEEAHEGLYQCYAENEFGIALSVKTLLKLADQEPFPTVSKPRIHRPLVGSSLTLVCIPPYSYPQGIVYWGASSAADASAPPSIGSDSSDKISKPIETTKRVALDYTGNLHFSNIEMNDARGGKLYICMAINEILRGTVQGDDQLIQPITVTATPKYQPPKIMWNSEKNPVAIKASLKKMKCIFAGYPTPTVTWTRLDAPLPEKVVTSNSFGQEIAIPDIDYTDGGRYQCSATNTESGAAATMEFKLRVESVPFWVTELENVHTSEEENVEFHCEAGGVPKPKLSWSVNGQPIEDMPSDSRRHVGDGFVRYTNLTKTDAQVLQCNASNKHGYIYSNAYLNVLAEPPSFIEPPKSVVKAAEGQNVNLTCRVFGAPKPVITWTRGQPEQEIRGMRFKVNKDGDLQIQNVLQQDQGVFKCKAVNKFGEIDASGDLLVRQPTIITTPPASQTVNASQEVIFHCEATTDPAEKAKLKIEWRRNDEEINYWMEGRISLNKIDNSLMIKKADVLDSGRYTCIASNGLDKDEVTVNLVVKDKPDPPYDIRIQSCLTNSAEISWISGPENNDEVQEFLVYYNTTFDDDGQYHKGADAPKGIHTARIGLSPWANYTFHVRARNSLGMSDRSDFSKSCTTQQTQPHKNPSGVCTESRGPDQLVIVWEPMPQIDHNGEGFHYIVAYKRLDIPDSNEIITEIYNWRQKELVVRNQETFKEYEIYVQAVNNKGQAPKLVKRLGHSGEDKPLEVAQDFQIDDSTLNSTSAVFLWEPVDESPERIRGHFRGYQIQFWKSGEDKEKRFHDVITSDYNPCPTLRGRHGGRGKRATELVRGHVQNLWPYSTITAGVVVLNGGQNGDMSDTIEFTTPEGVPSLVPMFKVAERGSHHFKLEWAPPLEANGILIGYTIGYRRAGRRLDPVTEIPINDPTKLYTKIRRLRDQQEYTLYIWARTQVGKGPRLFIDDRTLKVMEPDVPGFAEIMPGDTFFNASWVPTAQGPSRNPGSHFYVEYKNADDPDGEWIKSPDEAENNWINVTDLEMGAAYDVRIVAVNGIGDESRSSTKRVTTGPREEAIVQSVATAGWFIGMMVVIAFLLLILIIVCIIKRNRGGKYPVHEKEKLRGRDLDKDDEEGGFGEYTRTDEPEHKKSQASLNSAGKPMGSETDSMDEYDQMDPSKFNEDGSFIGLYGGEEEKKPEVPNDATSPSALSTLV